MDYQLFTNPIFMLLSLPVVYQSSANQPHIVAVATNYSNVLYQCFTNFYQSDLVLYITSLLMITNKLPIHHSNHSIGDYLPIGSQCFTNRQFINGTGKLPNSCQWFTFGSYWQ